MSFSLSSAVNICKVNTGYDNKIQSDRYENPNNLLCPLWNGLDQYGRVVCVDSYNTKYAGCSSALDRVAVENYQRPQYAEFIPLDTMGYLNPSALGSPVDPNTSYQKQTELLREKAVKEMYEKGGSVGIQYSKVASPYTTGQQAANGCPSGQCLNGFDGYRAQLRENYVDTRANRNFQERRDLSGISSWKSNCSACSAGNR
jgi:hypothetical protein